VTIGATAAVRGRYIARVPELRDTELDSSFKGIPLDRTLPLSAVAEQGWNVARGDMALPVLTLDAQAIDSNIDTMQRYCERNGVALAPHGKTTMSPQLFDAQLDAGSWAMTAATPTQASVMRRYGVGRIVLANELIDRAALTWVAAELARDPEFEFFCLVDNPDTVRTMDSILAEIAPARPLSVLVEVGRHGGRAGVRSVDTACEVAAAAHDSAHLQLRGVETFEGAFARAADAEALEILDELFESVRETVVRIAELGLFEGEGVIVTAGGSMYFDLVIDALSEWPQLSQDVKLVLRSGCYVSHDAGEYERYSPLAGRRPAGEALRLQDAVRLWGTVLSRPEPDIAIVGVGLRDAPVDRELPFPFACYRDGSLSCEISGRAEIYRMMDQHAFVRIEADADIRPGDTMKFGISHPCTAFDKFRFIPLVDEQFNVIDGVLTFF
jgi:D-serine dehydratase